MKDTSDTDRELVERAQAGDSEAFDRVVERHTPRLYRAVRRMASDKGEAESIVQEAWLRAWRALPRYVHDRPFFPWLARIATNVALDAWRKRRPLDFVDVGGDGLEFSEDAPSPEERIVSRETLARVAEGVERLRPEQRAVIALRYEAGLSYEEIARALDIPVNTVRTHLHRAKARLRKWREAEGDDGLAG
jgi:RNA polymerase sigma-70 factor (ECF subfamily)